MLTILLLPGAYALLRASVYTRSGASQRGNGNFQSRTSLVDIRMRGTVRGNPSVDSLIPQQCDGIVNGSAYTFLQGYGCVIVRRNELPD